MKQKRNYFLDISRGVAASGVAFYHFGEMRNNHDLYANLIEFGWLGVPVFFVISGFSISSSTNNTSDIKGYWLKRLFRIFPAYWISLLLILSIIIFQKLVTGSNSTLVLPHGINNFINTFFCLYPPLTNTCMMNWVYWTLIYELFFYFIFSFTLLLPYKFRSWYFILILFMGIFYGHFVDIKLLFFLKLIGYFGLGVALNEVRKGFTIEFFFIATFSILGIWLNKKYCIANDNKLNSEISIFVAILFSISVYVFSKYFTNKCWLTKLGDLSYGMYLFHIPLCIYLIRSFTHQYVSATNLLVVIPLDFFCFLLCITFSYFVYKYIELPLINFAKTKSLK